LPEVLKKLGFNPDELPASVVRKFKMKAPSTTAPAPAGDGELLRPAAPSAAPPANGGELLKEAPPPGAKKTAETAPSAEEDEPDPYTLDKDGNIIPDLPKMNGSCPRSW